MTWEVYALLVVSTPGLVPSLRRLLHPTRGATLSTEFIEAAPCMFVVVPFIGRSY
jgi:hypothetical protein